MKTAEAALVVFVKTPGLSPIKTRLAEGLGRARADEFYRLSLAAVEATVTAVNVAAEFCPYWAVAEEEGLADPRWQRFPQVQQGTGGLGERLGHVFAELQSRHDVVVAIGADSPQITPVVLRDAIGSLQQERADDAHVLGRCHDGGFYLVGTNHVLPLEAWRDVPYSLPAAADRLAANLAKHGKIVELARLTDVDWVDDLATIRAELIAVPKLSPTQLALLDWVTAALRGTAGGVRSGWQSTH